MRFADHLPPDRFWQHVSDLEAAVATSFTTFPVYGLSDHPTAGFLAEWDGDTICLQYGDLTSPYIRVHTTRTDPAEVVLRLRLTEDNLADLDAPPTSTLTLVVAGEPTEFDVWNNRYAASDTGVIVEWQNLEPTPVTLARVPDIEPYLQARRALLHRHRHETP